MKSTLETLIEAKQIISDPARWIKHTYAQNADGNPTEVLALDAVCFCMLGAVKRAYGDHITLTPMVRILANVIGRGEHRDNLLAIYSYNDKPIRSHQDVMETFDKAIKHALEETDV